MVPQQHTVRTIVGICCVVAGMISTVLGQNRSYRRSILPAVSRRSNDNQLQLQMAVANPRTKSNQSETSVPKQRMRLVGHNELASAAPTMELRRPADLINNATLDHKIDPSSYDMELQDGDVIMETGPHDVSPDCECSACESCQPGCGCETECDCDCGEPVCGCESDCDCECGEPVCGCESGCDCEDDKPSCFSLSSFSSLFGGKSSSDDCCQECCGGCDCGGCDGAMGGASGFSLWEQKRCEIFAGVLGFTGPPNAGGIAGTRPGGSGSFGFYQGANMGLPLMCLGCGDLGWQAGVRTTQSSLSGASFTNDSRGQVFVTSGLFRRSDSGLQCALAVDYLNENWYYDVDLVQLRGQFGWQVAPQNEFGFRFSTGLVDSASSGFVFDAAGTLTATTSSFEPLEQYRLYHRRALRRGVIAEVNAGINDDADIFLGSFLDVVLSKTVALRGQADYAIPEEGAASLGYAQESWNFSFGLVFTPCGRASTGDYFRPLLPVAGNGNFMVRRN